MKLPVTYTLENCGENTKVEFSLGLDYITKAGDFLLPTKDFQQLNEKALHKKIKTKIVQEVRKIKDTKYLKVVHISLNYYSGKLFY